MIPATAAPLLFRFPGAPLAFLVSIGAAFVIGIACATTKYKFKGITRAGRPVWEKEFHKSFARKKFYKKVRTRIIEDSMTRCLCTGMWALRILLIWLKMSRSIWRGLSVQQWIVADMVFVALLMLLYKALTSRCLVISRVPLGAFALLLVAIIYAPSVAGSVALRVLGIGGGIPVSLAVTPMGAAATRDVAVQTGCLIIRSSYGTILRPLDRPTPEQCQLHWFGPSTNDIPPRFSGVEVIPNTRILQLNAFKPPDT